MSNDKRPKKMHAYAENGSGKAPAAGKTGMAGRAAGVAAIRSANLAAGMSKIAGAAAEEGSQPAKSGFPLWGVLLFLLIGTGAGAGAVMLLPRLAPQLFGA